MPVKLEGSAGDKLLELGAAGVDVVVAGVDVMVAGVDVMVAGAAVAAEPLLARVVVSEELEADSEPPPLVLSPPPQAYKNAVKSMIGNCLMGLLLNRDYLYFKYINLI